VRYESVLCTASLQTASWCSSVNVALQLVQPDNVGHREITAGVVVVFVIAKLLLS